MSGFREGAHRRDVQGKFAEKPVTEPEVTLGLSPLNEFIDDNDARERVYALGESPQRRAEYARTTQNPADLVHLAWVSRYPGSDDAAMLNPAAPSALVYAIATDPSRARSQVARLRAVLHPNMPAEGLRELAHTNADEDYFAPALRASIAEAPNTPPDVLEELFDAHYVAAGLHPNFPRARLAAEFQNPERAHHVAGSPHATPEQLDSLRTLRYADEEDEDPLFRTVALSRAIKNPHATTGFLQALAGDTDTWVAKCARDALMGRAFQKETK